MYLSIIKQIFPILHYLFSFILLFYLLPIVLFKSEYEDKAELTFSGYIKMIFLLIISGYILVILKLYEVMSILMMLFVIIGIRYKQKHGKKAVPKTPRVLKRLFDFLDGLAKMNPYLIKTNIVEKQKRRRQNLLKRLNWFVVLEIFALVLIVASSAYARFYDAFKNAAPPLSDSYVTLAWMKYINNRDLFHDGIYPQGFHIYLSYLSKFAAVDSLYVLRYTGPLNTLLIAIGLYVVIRKLTNNAVGGLVAAWIYGVVLVIVPLLSIDRQAATNSQEFAFVFIFPTIYFLVKFFQTERKEDLVVGLLSNCITGLVHSLGFALAGLIVGILIFSSFITLRKRWKVYIKIIVGALLTVVISMIPLGVGYLLGKGLNSSSAEYLASQVTTYHYKKLTLIDYIALGSILLLMILQLRRKLTKNERFIGLFTILTGLSVFILYYAGGVLTKSTVIDTRSMDLWGLILPFCIGISVSFLFNVFKEKPKQYVNGIIMVGLSIVTIIYRPNPIIPYKLEYNENVEQYFEISKKYLPQTWLIVSQDEGYSISLGTGFHMHLGDFLKTYNPDAQTLTKFNEGAPDKNLPPHIFIFKEKKVFEVSKTNSIYSLLEPKYKQRAKEYKEVTKWIKTHRESGYKTKIFFENKHIIVYQLDIPKNINK